ncbi:MAG TPA: cellulase family glycosylhydrolase [Myxococcota bacterium]|nr:cellulase family glycosylhydrolase [Myxococcota bacterium]HOC99668.1 cellulase family glycosylhydrolase [Myxococcota bacterium]HOH76041.1 cellulase family glycosylhydrolase [Myxococcota bacterium]HPV03929.1 cellulase family glycosylhydrolase [Myxococcota bacterium]
MRSVLIAIAFLAVTTGCGDDNQHSGDIPGDDVMMDSGSDTTSPDVVPDVAGDTAPDVVESGMSRLRAEGMNIVDEDGNVVVLKGVNLGGYLYHETWLTLVDYSAQARAWKVAVEMELEDIVRPVLVAIGPQIVAGMVGVSDGSGGSIGADAWLELLRTELGEVADTATVEAYFTELEKYLPAIYDDSDLPIYTKLEERFGIEARDSLLDTYQGAWIQERDIEWLAGQGFNLVRVPIGYRTLTKGSHLAQPTELVWNEDAFARIHALLDWCEKWGVYAVLDIQECPGGQNDYSGPALLYSTQMYQDMTVDLWEEMSARFHDRNVVAAYSLLAEPMGAPSRKARDDMYDKLVKAIRALGDDHLLVIHDGFKGMDGMADPAEYGWTNVVFSTHIFEWSARNFDTFKGTVDLYDFFFRTAQETRNVPYFIGSFSGIFDEPWAYEAVEYIVEWMGKYGWSWSLWAYKDVQDPVAADLWGDKSSWGVKSRLVGEFDRPDLFIDSEETVRQKFASYGSLELEVNQTLLDVLKADLQSQPE